MIFHYSPISSMPSRRKKRDVALSTETEKEVDKEREEGRRERSRVDLVKWNIRADRYGLVFAK